MSRTVAVLSANSERIYAAIGREFYKWRAQHGLTDRLPRPSSVADYLRKVRAERGPSAVPVHLSAVARIYRKAGVGFDTLDLVIQATVASARRAMRARRGTPTG